MEVVFTWITVFFLVAVFTAGGYVAYPLIIAVVNQSNGLIAAISGTINIDPTLQANYFQTDNLLDWFALLWAPVLDVFVVLWGIIASQRTQIGSEWERSY